MKVNWCGCRRSIASALASAMLVVACGGGGGAVVVADPGGGGGGVVADPGAGGGVVPGPGTGGSDPVVTPPPAQSAPVITQQPASQSVVEDASVTFSVGLQQAAGASYQWMRDGVDVAGAMQPSFTLAAAGWGDDASSWSVRIANAAGTTVSNSATLTITERPVQTPLGVSVFSRGPIDEMPIAVDRRGNVITVPLDYQRNPVLGKYSPSGAPRPYGSHPQGITLAAPPRDGSIMFALDGSDQLHVAYTVLTLVAVADSDFFPPTSSALYVLSPGGEARLLYTKTRPASDAFPVDADSAFLAAMSIVTDAQGALYMVDAATFSVRKRAADGTLTRLAAVEIPPFGFADATQLAWDPAGSIYLVNPRGRTVSRLGVDGKAVLLAGNATSPAGLGDGTGSGARFFRPTFPVSDAAGNLYVLDDTYVRRITPAGEVKSLFGKPANPLDPLYNPLWPNGAEPGHGLAIDRDGVLYFKANGSIVKLRLK
jgi:hypothetical protein